MVWRKKHYIKERIIKERHKNNISYKDINMVQKIKVEELVVDAVAVATANMVRGRANNATNIGKFIVSDIIYEYALDDSMFEKSVFAMTGENVSIPAKILGLTLTNVLINLGTGSSAKFTDAIVDSSVASAAFWFYKRLPALEEEKKKA